LRIVILEKNLSTTTLYHASGDFLVIQDSLRRFSYCLFRYVAVFFTIVMILEKIEAWMQKIIELISI